MSPSIAYALGALLLYGFADFVYKRGAAAGALPHQFLMVQTWFFNALALLYGLFSGTLAFNAGALGAPPPARLVVTSGYATSPGACVTARSARTRRSSG